jgi:outer membrane protein assembly factor BamB
VYRLAGSLARSLVVVAAGRRVLAYRRQDGAVAWAYDFPTSDAASPYTPLAVEFLGERVYVARPDAVVCFEYLTGGVIGEFKLPERAARPQLLIDGDDIFVSGEHTLMCFDVSGQLRWQAPHGISMNGSPTLAVPGNVRAGDGLGFK